MADPEISVINGNIVTSKADVLVLKYAGNFHGADNQVAARLPQMPDPVNLALGQHAVFDGAPAIGAARVIFIGVRRLLDFGYGEIRRFGRDAVRIACQESPDARSLMLTIHGVGYGLDERESFTAQLAGMLEAIESGEAGELESINVVERDAARAKRLAAVLEEVLSASSAKTIAKGKLSKRINAGESSLKKRHVFVAMPFSDDMQDVFEFGIKEPINNAGLLCERVDMSVFTGDIVQRIKDRINTACLVVADMTGSNPNVYLEVGYAWGRDRCTLLLIKKNVADLKFDVRSYNCIEYSSIRELRERMNASLPQLVDDL